MSAPAPGVTGVTLRGDDGWQVDATGAGAEHVDSATFDYLVNACGFRSGEIDDMVGIPRARMVEFKAAYLAHWEACEGSWPELIVFGERGTPDGTAQLLPYPDGYFQIHAMTRDITLFGDGLVASSADTAQPRLPAELAEKLVAPWPPELVRQRTEDSIAHMARYIPSFASARGAARPLFGAQQIPGDDPDLRVADVSFHGRRYACAEIVKASSALCAADKIVRHLIEGDLLDNRDADPERHHFPVTRGVKEADVARGALILAEQRGYPASLAMQIR